MRARYLALPPGEKKWPTEKPRTNPKRALENEFAGLTADEVSGVEQLYRTSFDAAG